MKTNKTVAFLWPLIFCTATALTAAENKEITVKLTFPHSAWTISIEEVYQTAKEIWVISRVSCPADAIAMQVISTRRDSVKLATAERPVKHFIMGKTWKWKNEEPYTFIKDLKIIEKELRSAKILYRKADKKPH